MMNGEGRSKIRYFSNRALFDKTGVDARTPRKWVERYSANRSASRGLDGKLGTDGLNVSPFIKRRSEENLEKVMAEERGLSSFNDVLDTLKANSVKSVSSKRAEAGDVVVLKRVEVTAGPIPILGLPSSVLETFRSDVDSGFFQVFGGEIYEKYRHLGVFRRERRYILLGSIDNVGTLKGFDAKRCSYPNSYPSDPGNAEQLIKWLYSQGTPMKKGGDSPTNEDMLSAYDDIIARTLTGDGYSFEPQTSRIFNKQHCRVVATVSLAVDGVKLLRPILIE